MGRSIKKGPYIDAKLAKKVEAQKESGKRDGIKTWGGNGAIIEAMSPEDATELSDLLTRYQVAGVPDASEFKKIVSDKRLYNFDKADFKIWRTAL